MDHKHITGKKYLSHIKTLTFYHMKNTVNPWSIFTLYQWFGETSLSADVGMCFWYPTNFLYSWNYFSLGYREITSGRKG